MAQKRKLFVEKHDREKVNFLNVIYFFKILNDAHAHTHTKPKPTIIIFSQFINSKMGFALSHKEIKMFCTSTFPKIQHREGAHLTFE